MDPYANSLSMCASNFLFLLDDFHRLSPCYRRTRVPHLETVFAPGNLAHAVLLRGQIRRRNHLHRRLCRLHVARGRSSRHRRGCACLPDGTLPDPNYGMNLKNLPGMNSPARLFANADIPADSPFLCSHWFRREFTLPAGPRALEPISSFPRHQLPRQHLAQRQENRRPKGGRRRISDL